jgi:tripartite-type tricarboxylate transporter receptor subunit TctC
LILKIARSAAAAFVATALLAPPAHTQPYPSKPIKIVVPFAAGGAVDVVARVVGQRVSEQVNQPVIVDNKPGGHANIGADFVAKAPPDGYTLLLGANGLASNMTLHKNLPFDTLRDFAPVAAVGYAPLVFVVPTGSPAKTSRWRVPNPARSPTVRRQRAARDISQPSCSSRKPGSMPCTFPTKVAPRHLPT